MTKNNRLDACCFAPECERQPAPDSKFCVPHRAAAEKWLDETRWAEAEDDSRLDWIEDWNALGWNRGTGVSWRLDDPDVVADAEEVAA